MKMLTVYTLELEWDGFPKGDDKLIRLPPPIKPYGLRFIVPAGSEASRQGVFSTNYPINKTNFNRNKFYTISPSLLEHHPDSYYELLIEQSGIFQYSMKVGAGDNKLKDNASLGYFIVDPDLKVKGEPLPLDAINLLSIVPKWLGPIDSWSSHFEAASSLNYNFIHFVPIQQRGASNSPYSISDQLKLSSDLFAPATKSEEEKTKVIASTIQQLRCELGLLSLVDMVWNHTSFDSEWLWDHPEAGYNVQTAPHLRPAYELDTALLNLSTQLQSEYGLRGVIESEKDLNEVVDIIRNNVLPSLKLYEFYILNVQTSIDELLGEKLTWGGKDCSTEPLNDEELSMKLISEALIHSPGVRFGLKLDLTKLYSILKARMSGTKTKDEVGQIYKSLLEKINIRYYTTYDEDLKAMLDNITNHMRFQRLAENGPRYKEISAKVPLLQTYFTRLPKNARTAKHHDDALALANNGWVWAADPKVDFASPLSSAYLRRDVIIWGDCVKLRYGQSPEDNPWLWERMLKYTQSMASLFDGFRIDNCHSTPVPLAEYLLDAARHVNPNLYVVAELFTGSEDADKEYVCRLGINSLIREAMQASDPHELSRLVHRYGGVPVGSLDEAWRTHPGMFLKSTPCKLIPTKGAVTHSLFMDCTHDNETPAQKRHAIDALPNTALVCMTYCAVGSVKGYDEAYPKLLDLVHETRMYLPLSNPLEHGLGKAKQQLLKLHYDLCQGGYTEVHVHHEGQFVLVHRQHPNSHDGYLLIAHTAFQGSAEQSHISPVKLRGTLGSCLGAYRLKLLQEGQDFSGDKLFGLATELEELDHPKLIPGQDHLGKWLEVDLAGVTRGSVIILKTVPDGLDIGVTRAIGEGAEKAVASLGPNELNILLFRCHEEEQDTLGSEWGVYGVPNHRRLSYCGLQGFISELKPIMLANDLGHPLCQHLRDGRWALEYTISRLNAYLPSHPTLKPVVDWLQCQTSLLEPIPPHLFPKYFSIIIFSLYNAGVGQAFSGMSPMVKHGDEFVKGLALCAIQLNGQVKSTGLHPSRPGPCLAAGLPHFSTNHMRCWGRDTFISLRGIFLCTGQFKAAQDHLLAFAGSVKHGLVPNLLDSLRRPRYNARDATFWFLQAVQDYCTMAPNGLDLLKEPVPRRFPDGETFIEADDSSAYSCTTLFVDIIQEILQRHAKGIKFREWNAGPNLDNHMSDAGFDINIHLDLNTGFLHGGNLKNCGTWMDKMGESTKAGTMGVPATPRDGAPVEITGLLKSTLRWLNSLPKDSFPYDSVMLDDNKSLSYHDWDKKIQTNFEPHYYIPANEDLDKGFKVNGKMINRRGIYKDTVGGQKEYTDYQLRPNFLVAMAVAPELFSKDNATLALNMATRVLVSPQGMKTLDPQDWAYRGDYDNSNDSTDPTIAKGFNYHQGPEWGWCLGYYLRAKLKFSTTPDEANIHSYLRYYKDTLRSSPFSGLAELTNANGKYCKDSCATQAWSAATALDALYDLYSMTHS